MGKYVGVDVIDKYIWSSRNIGIELDFSKHRIRQESDWGYESVGDSCSEIHGSYNRKGQAVAHILIGDCGVDII
jgi:hypothetical protein